VTMEFGMFHEFQRLPGQTEEDAFTLSFAYHFAPKVRCNVLSPGAFLTDIAKAWAPEKREKSRNGIGRPGRPEEIRTAALFLASPHSSYATGALVQVDGGVVPNIADVGRQPPNRVRADAAV